jgi:hypothetical protein
MGGATKNGQTPLLDVGFFNGVDPLPKPSIAADGPTLNSAWEVPMEMPNRGLLEFFHQDRHSVPAAEPTAALPQPVVRPPRQPRRDQRCLAPYGSSTIEGEIEMPSGTTIQITLWDLSERGVCVMAHGPFGADVHRPLRVTLDDGLGHERVTLDAVLEWKDSDRMTTFAGLMFVGDTSMIKGSFLAAYLHS